MWGMFAGGARLPGPFEGRDAARRIGPFALVVAGGFVLVPAQRHGSVTELLLAAAGSLVPIGLALWVPWKRVPRWLQALPLLAYLVWVAFLRDYCGGGRRAIPRWCCYRFFGWRCMGGRRSWSHRSWERF